MRHDLRLAVPVAAAWIAVGLCIAAPAGLLPVSIGAWGAALAFLLGAVWRGMRARATGVRAGGVRAGVVRAGGAGYGPLVLASLSCAFAAVLLTSAMARAPDRQPAELVEASDAGRFVTAEATVTQTVPVGTRSFTAVLDRVTVGAAQLDVSVPVRVFGHPAGVELGIGSVVEVSGTLSASAPEDAVAFLLFPVAPPETLRPPPAGLEWADALRSDFRRAAGELPGNGAALLPGLAIGDTTAVSEELDASMKSSSLSHLTAVSGANCAIVVAAIMIAGGAIGLPLGGRMALSVVVLAGFVVLVTPEPSVLRASVMAVLVIANAWRGRPGRGVPVLALAVFALLAFDPWLSREYGFILSVLATGGLLLLAGPLAGLLARFVPTPIAAVIAVPLAAQLTCQPVLVLLSSTIPAYGVLANVLAAPAAPMATMLGLVACLALPIAPDLGALLVKAAWGPSAWIAAVSTYFSRLPGSSIPWPAGAAGGALLVVVTAVSLIVLLPRPGAAPRTRRGAAVLLGLIVVSGAGTVAGSSIRSALARPANWQYAACDIGQGDAVLVRSAGEIALIDTGPDPAPLNACLQTLGIERIDLLVLTHFDLDHAGGVDAVLGRADRALLGPVDRPEAERIVESLRAAGADPEQLRRGAEGRLGDLRWTVQWPPPRIVAHEEPNDLGIVLRFEGVGQCPGRCLSSMFLADLGEEAQRRLAATGRIAPVDVVKVAHHGSADQSVALYEALNAPLGIISVGAENTYGHPTSRILEALKAAGTAVARTDTDGLLLVAPADDGGMTVWSERNG